MLSSILFLSLTRVHTHHCSLNLLVVWSVDYQITVTIFVLLKDFFCDVSLQMLRRLAIWNVYSTIASEPEKTSSSFFTWWTDKPQRELKAQLPSFNPICCLWKCMYFCCSWLFQRERDVAGQVIILIDTPESPYSILWSSHPSMSASIRGIFITSSSVVFWGLYYS